MGCSVGASANFPLVNRWAKAHPIAVTHKHDGADGVPLAAATTVAPVEQSDDGWVTFGRVKVDIKNETETFERISPPVATPAPLADPEDEVKRLPTIAEMSGSIDFGGRVIINGDDQYVVNPSDPQRCIHCDPSFVPSGPDDWCYCICHRKDLEVF